MVAPPFCLAALITQSLQMRQGNGGEGKKKKKEEEVEEEEEEEEYIFGTAFYQITAGCNISHTVHSLIYFYCCYYLLLGFCTSFYES